MNVVFITRTKAKNEEELKDSLKEIIKEIYEARIKKIFVISNLKDNKLKIGKARLMIIHHEDPTSSTSLNNIFKKLKNTDYFLISSKEVDLRRKNIKELIKEIKSNKKLLVVGYKFIITNKKLNKVLQRQYTKNLISFRVPWNTCAIWNNKKFKSVGKFDLITNKKPFKEIPIGRFEAVELKGMEDGLAIAKATSKEDIFYKLLDKNLTWKIDLDDKQEKKLLRKEDSLRYFMEKRGYKIEKLEKAELKNN